MESINTSTQHSNFFNTQNNAANNFYYASQDSIQSQTMCNFNKINYESTVSRTQQPKRTEVSVDKLEKLRKLQDRVDKLEAEKESLVNQVYDLRQLMQKVNKQGESKLVYIKNRNAELRTRKQALLKALEITRENAAHFNNVSTYWSWNINSYCDSKSKISRDFESAKNNSFGTSTTSTGSHNDLPSLTTASSLAEDQQINIGADFIICCSGKAHSHHQKHSASAEKFDMMRSFEMAPRFSEQQEQQQEQQLLLQPNLLSKNNKCASATQSSRQSVVVGGVDDRDFRGSDCGLGKYASKSVEESSEKKPIAGAKAASLAMAAHQ